MSLDESKISPPEIDDEKVSRLLDLVIEMGQRNLDASATSSLSSTSSSSSLFSTSPSTRLGDFEIRRLIGEGTFGRVYEAWDSLENKVVALKVAREFVCSDLQLKQRFLQEIQLANKLDHPGIVKVLRWGEQDGLLYFAMEFCKGRTLTQFIADNQGSLPIRWLVSVLKKVALAVNYAHQHGVIHRDLKPDNVMVLHSSPDKIDVRILDFGLALEIQESFQRTSSGTMIGSPMYMAPEQLHASGKPSSKQSDIYALGTILYQCLTGVPHVKAETLPQMIDDICAGKIEPPRKRRPELPLGLELICLKCLRNIPEQRYASAGELAEDLDAWSAGRPIKACPPTLNQRFLSWMRKSNRGVEFGLGLIVINLLVLGWAVLNYPLAIWLFPPSTGDQQSQRMFLEVLLAIIPIHCLLLWSSIRIYQLRQTRRGVWMHFVFTILIALIAIPLICVENPISLQLNRFERLAALGLMTTFAEIQTLLTLMLLVYPYRRPLPYSATF